MLLLDTCALLWLADAQERLSDFARRAIVKNAGGIHVSAISAFELGVKTRKRKLVLPLPAGEWYGRALELHGLREIPISGAIAARSASLEAHHNDPCDRFIIATALEFGCPVVTADGIFSSYAGLRVVW
jgi:PIN domain nuclease of toxin-antitoxin system